MNYTNGSNIYVSSWSDPVGAVTVPYLFAADSFFRFPFWYDASTFTSLFSLSAFSFSFPFSFRPNVTNCLSSSRWQLVASSYRDAWPRRPVEISDSSMISQRARAISKIETELIPLGCFSLLFLFGCLEWFERFWSFEDNKSLYLRIGF